jgi:CspA family cold shock protein
MLSTSVAVRLHGRVKWFNDAKGYGFITRDDGTTIFVHFTEIVTQDEYKSMSSGDFVSFEIGHSNRGQRALNVRIEQRAAPRIERPAPQNR